MDGFTLAAEITLENDRATAAECLRLARLVLSQRKPDDFEFEIDKRIGDAILGSIGERLSDRFDGAVPHDGIHELLWMTLVGHVAWAEIGKLWHNRVLDTDAGAQI